MSLIKSKEDIRKLRQAGQILAQVLEAIKPKVQVGVSLAEIDAHIHQLIVQSGATPSFLGYQGFPNASCLSLNEQVVHGIPDQRVLKEGDVLGVDAGLWYEKVCVDSAISLPVGTISPKAADLLLHTQEALQAGIKAARPFQHVGAISAAIQAVAEQYGLGIVRTLTGHGVGHGVHELPEIPNFGHPAQGIFLKPGMVLAIEPMFTLGQGDVLTENDGWGVITADQSLAAHYEHTVVITQKGAEILTKIAI